MSQPSFLNRQDVTKMLDDLAFTPRKRFGQSFLVDRRAVFEIVEALDPGLEDIVIEIGPGLGALTGELLGKVSRVIAIEIDHELSELLRQRFCGRQDFKLINEDFLSIDLAGLLNELLSEVSPQGRVKVVGNLPYRISTQILFNFLECSVHPERMIFAFQWEVAARLTARPGTKDYGALTLITEFYTQVKSLRRIKKESFVPVPEIDTGIVFFRFRSLNLELPAHPQPILFQLIKAAFAQRRKTLKNALTKAHNLPYTLSDVEQAISLCRWDCRVRGETLTLEDFARLLKALEKFKTHD